MMSPTNLCLLLCLSVHYVTSASPELNNDEVLDNVRKDLNNLNSLVDESNNRNELDENLNLEKTAADNNNLLNSLSSSNLLNKLNLQVHSGDAEDTNSLRNLRSNLKPVNGVHDLTNPLNYLNNVNLLRNSHGLEVVSNPVEVRSAVVSRNGLNPYEDGSSLSALLALNRLGVSSNRVGGLVGLNVLARNGASSSVDLDGLDNVNVRTANELNKLSGNRRSDLNNLESSGHYLNQLSDSDLLNTVERNNPDELSDDLLGLNSKQVLVASLNKLKEDNRRGLLKPVRLAKELLVGRSGGGLDEDNLLNALESHNKGQLNALSALATLSNLNDNDYEDNLKSSKSLLNSNNLVNNAVEVSSVESEADNLNELENLNKTPESLLNDADSSESESYLQSRYPEKEVNEVNNRRSAYLNNELLNTLRLLYGGNRGLGGPAPLLPYSRPVSVNPYGYYDSLPLNPYVLNNQRNVGVSPYMLRGRSGLITSNNLNEVEELSNGLVDDKDLNGNDENRADNLGELHDYNVDNLLDSLNNVRLNALSLGKNNVRSSKNQNQENVNDFANRLSGADTNNVNDLGLVDVEVLSGRRLGTLETLNPNLGANVNNANVLRNLGNLNNNSLRRRSQKKSDSLPVGLNNNLALDKLAKLHGVLRLTEDEELTLDEAKQLVARGLHRSDRRHF